MACSCRDAGHQGVAPVSGQAVAAAPQPVAVELAPFRQQLLRSAFAAASMFPLDPHRKNRSRAQELVVTAAFELEQPDLAVGFAEHIADWRRGCAYADYAWEMAKRGRRELAEQYVQRAETVQQAERENPNGQEWRGDLIALKLSRACRELGDAARAERAAAGIDLGSTHAVDASWSQTAAERVRLLAPADGAKELAALDNGFPTMSLGQQSTALVLMARMHERFFADRELRRALEERVVRRHDKMMPALRLDVLATMVRTSMQQGERAGAAALLAVARGLVENHSWRAEDRLPQQARLCELMFVVGEVARARAAAEQALQEWHRDREQIIDIFRAESLRPLALAWFTMGEPDLGHDLLAQVIEEGMENPNSRPRCDDLVETLVAMAKAGIEPRPALTQRIREIVAGLGEPW